MYPYFIIPDIELLDFPLVGSPQREKAIRRIAANIGDPLVVRRLLKLDPAEFASFYPDMGAPATPSTLDTIDSFLSTYSREAKLEAKKEAKTQPAPAPAKAATLKLSINELIRAHRYEDAIERIKLQNLNNPEKSIYFADQIRFLRKLILLSKERESRSKV